MRVSQQHPLFTEITLDWAHGRCAWFALAASARWNFPLVGFVDEAGCILHVACETEHGLFDAYGLGTEAQVVEAFRSLGATSQMKRCEVSADRVREEFFLTEPEHAEEINDAIFVCDRVINELGLRALFSQ